MTNLMDAKIDAYIAYNAKHWKALKAMSRDRLERTLVALYVQRDEAHQRTRTRGGNGNRQSQSASERALKIGAMTRDEAMEFISSEKTACEDAFCLDCNFQMAGGASVGLCPRCGGSKWYRTRLDRDRQSDHV